jgi:hypothetical protein
MITRTDRCLGGIVKSVTTRRSSMNEPKWKWLDAVGDGLLGGVLAAVILLCYLITCLGCTTTCPPCQPTIETVEVKVPVYSCPSPPESEMPLAPAYPILPDQSSDQDIKAWYAEVASLVKAREKILLDYVKYLQDILEEYRTE